MQFNLYIILAGTVTVISPLELVRTKMQSKRLSHQGEFFFYSGSNFSSIKLF